MPKVPYKFAITNAAGQYYQVGGTLSPTPVYLSRSIVDWDTLALNYRRDSVFLGMFRSYSPESVRFVKDAAKILRYIKNTQGGAEAVAYLSINLLNKSTQQYDLLDYWQFDFSVTNNQQFYYEAKLMEGGASALLKAYANNNYNTPLNDPALLPPYPAYNPVLPDTLDLFPTPTNNPLPAPTPKLIYCDGIPILSQAQFTTLNDSVAGPHIGEVIIVDPSSPAFGDGVTLGLANFKTDGDYFSQVGTTNNPLIGVGIGNASIANASLFTAAPATSNPAGCKMKIKYNLNLSWTNGGTDMDCLRLFFNIHSGSIPIGAWHTDVSNTTIIEDAPLGIGLTRNNVVWKGETDWIILTPGQILSIGFNGIFGTGTLLTVDIPFTDVSLSNPTPAIILQTIFLPQSSVVRAVSHFDLFQYLSAQLLTNGGLLAAPLPGLPTDWSKSTLLSTARDSTAPGNFDLDPSCTFFTCADSLRGLKTVTIVDPYYPIGDPLIPPGSPFECYIVPAIYTNMADFAKDLLTDLCGGIGIEKTGIGTDKIVAESLYYFFDDNTVIANLGKNISNFSMTDCNDYRGSGIAFGQQDQQFDAINGPLETLSEVDYTTPITRVIKNIEHKTPYTASPYQIELFRANIGNKTNVNSSSDNDTCKLQVASLVAEEVLDLDNWGGLSGYAFTTEALKLKRANIITSGLPAALLTPAVGDFAMYNLTFSPQRKALRSLPWLCSNYQGLIDSLMGISGYKKNILLVSDLGSGPVTESNWINLAPVAQTYTPPFSSNPVTVPPPPVPAGRTNNLIFKPYWFSFTSPVPLNLPLLMTPPGTPGGGKMYGKIEFIFERDNIDYPLAGFVFEAGITPGTNATYNYRLLASPTCEIPDTL